MAEGSPNTSPMSLKFDTGLDNSGFKQGADELRKELTSLKSTVSRVSDDMNKAFSKATSSGSAKTYIKTFEELQEDVNRFAQACEKVDGAPIDEALGTLAEMEGMLDSFGKSMYKLEGGLTVFGHMTKHFAVMSDALEQLKQHVDNTIGEAMGNAVGSMEDYQAVAQKFANTIDLIFKSDTPEQAKAALEQLREQMESFSQMKFKNEDGVLFDAKDSDLYKEMETTISDIAKAIEDAATNPDVEQAKEDAKNIPEQVEEGATAIGEALGGVEGAAQGAAGAAAGTAGAMGTLAAAAVLAGNGLTKLGGKMLDSAATNFKNLASAALKTGKNLAQIGFKKAVNGFASINKEAMKAVMNLGQVAGKKVMGGLKGLVSSLLGAGRSAKQFGQRATLSFRQVLGYAIGINSLAQVFRTLKSAVTEGFSKLAEADPQLKATVDGLKQSVEQLKVSFAAAFLPLLDIVLPVIQTIIDALSRATAFLGQFIAGLTGNSTYKRVVANQNAAAAAADNAAESYDNAAEAAKKEQKTIASFDELHIIDEKEESANKNNGINNNKKGNEPAYSLEDVPIASDIDNLADKLKKMWELGDFTDLGRMLGENLKKFLDSIPWDQIQAFAEKLGKSLATLLNGFMEVPGLFYSIGKTIAEVINTIFSFLNGLVSNLHWDSLGKAIKDFIMGLLENIDWDLIYDTFAKLGAGIGTALENAFDNPEIWEAIFTTLSHAVEAILLFIFNLFSVPDWASIARNIGTGINKGIEEFPWQLLSDTLALVLNSLFEFAYNLLTSIDFYGLGAHIGQALTDAVVKTDWSLGGRAVAAFINDIFDLVNGFLENTNFAELGKAVIDAITGFFSELDMSKWSQFLSNVWIAIFDFLSGAIEEVDWKNLPQNILNKISEFFSGFDWERIKESADRLYNALSTAIDEIEWAEIPGMVVDAIKDFFGKVEWDPIAEGAMTLLGKAFGAAVTMLVAAGGLIRDAFQNIIDGGLEGIVDGLKNIGTWLYEHVVTPFVEGFKSVFQINSPSKVMEPIGLGLLEGVGEGIISWILGIPKWLDEHVFTPVVDGFKSIFGIGSDTPALFSIGTDLISGLGGGIISWITGIPGWLQEHVGGPVVDGIKTLFGVGSGDPALQESGSQTMGGFLGGMTNALGNAFGWVKDNIVSKIVDPVEEGFGINGSESSTFSEYGNVVTSSIGSSIEAGAPQVEAAVKDLTESMQEFFKNVDWSQFGKMMCEGMVKGLNEGKPAFTKASLEVVTEALTAIGEFYKNVDWNKVSGVMCTGMIGGLEKGKPEFAKALLNVVSEALVALQNFFKNVDWSKVSGVICTGMASGLEKGKPTLTKALTALANSVYTTIKNALGISSSSKKFAEIGAQVPNGLAQGILNAQKTAAAASKELAAAVIEAAKQLTEMKDVGVQLVESLEKGLTESTSSLIQCVKNAVVEPTIKSLKDGLGTSGTPFSEEDGEKVVEGLNDGMTDEADKIDDVIDKEIVSPIKEKLRSGLGTDSTPFSNEEGKAVIKSFKEGMSAEAGSISDLIRTDVVEPVIDAFKDLLEIEYGDESRLFKDIGADAINSFFDGISVDESNVSEKIDGIADDILGAFGQVDWSQVGWDILKGIDNGLYEGWDWIYGEVTNVAYSLLESAKAALGIASPSKEFEWVGEMITKGLAEGLDGTQKEAVTSAQNLAEAVLDGVNDVDPTIGMEAGIDGLDNVLSAFSDRVVNGFSEMVRRMESIAESSSFYTPAMAAGTVLPFYANNDTAGIGIDTMTRINERLAMMNSMMMTRSDLQEILERVFRNYMNISFYLGDEQVARHANAGNAKIERRYSPVAGT